MKARVLRPAVLMAMLTIAVAAFANSRETIRNSIASWGECKNVAITRTNGDLALYGDNGYSCGDCPTALVDKLHELHDDGKEIKEVVLTERGEWFVLWGGNGGSWSNGVPRSMITKFREFNDNNEEVTSITFNDSGEWAIVTTDHIAADNNNTRDWLGNGNDDYGSLWSVHFTDNGKVAVYESGYKFRGDVPEAFKDALSNAEIDVYRAKFAGTAWFYADRYGEYNYNM